MEAAIQTMVKVFLKSSKGKEDLGDKEFQSLVKNQLHNILTDTDSSEAVKNMRKGLDDNKDGKVNFSEYMHLVGYLANALSDQHATTNETQAENAAPVAAEAEPKKEAGPEPKKEVMAEPAVVKEEEKVVEVEVEEEEEEEDETS